MINLEELRVDPQKYQNGAKNKNIDINVQEILDLDVLHRELIKKVQVLREERNKVAKERNIERGKEIKQELDKLETELDEAQNRLKTLLWSVPNPAKSDVKVGKDDSENEVIKTHGTPRKFDFKIRDHLELGEMLDIIDVKRAAKVSGARFYYLKNEGALLEQALVRFALDTLLKEGFHFVMPPVLIKIETMKKLGYMENGGDEDMFVLDKDGYVLVGTAEQALVPMYMDETIDEKDLPIRLVGYSPSFRREAGSYGKDTRGILRVHEFNKVEMVSFVAKGKDDAEHEYLLGLEEKFFQALGIPYQVIKMCTGDLGFPAARKFDIEAWMPGQKKYREVTSVSTVTDFQSRRLNTKYRAKEGNEYVQILNGTAFSIGRPIIAILENFQEEDGSVVIPEVLRKYAGFDKISPKS